MTKREEIIQSLLVKLKTMTALPSAKIVRSRIVPNHASKLPFLSISPVSDDVLSISLPFEDRSLKVAVSIWQRGAAPDQAADPIVQEMVEKIKSDLTLGGLAMDIEEISTSFEFEDGDDPLVAVMTQFEIKYRNS